MSILTPIPTDGRMASGAPLTSYADAHLDHAPDAGSVSELASLLATARVDLPDPAPAGLGAGWPDDDRGFDACAALVVDDDWMVRRQVGWVLGHAGVEVVLDTVAAARRCEQVVLAGLAAAPAVAVIGDLAGCDLDHLLAAMVRTSPDTAVVVYRSDEPWDLAAHGAVWVAKPDLEALERTVRAFTGTGD